MKLSRRQMIALMMLDGSFCALEWTAINAALKMCGERNVNGRVVGMSLVRKGLAEKKFSTLPCFVITDKGREVSKAISVKLMTRHGVQRLKGKAAKTKRTQSISSVVYDLLQGIQRLNQERCNRSSGPGIPVEYVFDWNDRYLYLRHQDSGETFRVSVERINDHKNLRIM